MNVSGQAWVRRLAPYKTPDNARGFLEIVVTIVPFVAIWAAMLALYQVHFILTLLLAVPAGCLMVRMFIIQHDCGHQAMFDTAKLNDWVGRVLGIVTLTPYDYWRRSHAMHHAASGNLDRRGIGDINTLTISEYSALGRFERLKYRLYRHPIVMFGIGPAYLFLLQHRLPLGAMRLGLMPWVSVLLTNLGIVLTWGGMAWLVGIVPFLTIQIPIVLVGASIGVWLFYVQHQFDETEWDHSQDWSREHSALHGSSFYDLPQPLMWLTGNIGIHHVHHLSSRIPFHQLPKVIRDFPELKQIGRLTLWESIKCVPLTLWDEEARRLVSFRDARLKMAMVRVTA